MSPTYVGDTNRWATRGATQPGPVDAVTRSIGDDPAATQRGQNRVGTHPSRVVAPPPFSPASEPDPSPVAEGHGVRDGSARGQSGSPALSLVGGTAEKGESVIGLEDRLRRVQGIADLTVELGEGGLESIRVKIDEGTDEAAVLEEIRRILVAYGLRSRRNDRPLVDATGARTVGEAEGPLRPRITVGPRGEGLYVRLTEGERIVERTGDRSPVGVAEAMIKAVAEWRGVGVPERIALALDELDGTPVVTMLGRRDGRTAVAAASCAVSLAGGMYQAAVGVLTELEPVTGMETVTG